MELIGKLTLLLLTTVTWLLNSASPSAHVLVMYSLEGLFETLKEQLFVNFILKIVL